MSGRAGKYWPSEIPTTAAVPLTSSNYCILMFGQIYLKISGLGERTHFVISGHFVITEFDTEGVYCAYLY